MKKLLLTLSAILLSAYTLTANAQEEKVFDAPYYSDFLTEDAWNMHKIVKNGGQVNWMRLPSQDNESWWAHCNNRFLDPTLPYADKIKDENKVTETADAWLMTPPINIYQGAEYTIQMILCTPFNMGSGTVLSLFVGEKDATPAQFKHISTIRDIPDYTKGGTVNFEFSLYEIKYTATENMVGRFAFVCNNEADKILWMHSYAVISSTTTSAPAPCENFNVEAAPEGELKATVTFDAPVYNTDGSKITKINRIRVVRDGLDEIEVLENVEPGQKNITVIDNNPSVGLHNFAAFAYTDGGQSEPVSMDMWIGEDLPAAPQNVQVVKTQNGYTISWDAPSQGLNDGYLNSETLKYDVFWTDGQMPAPVMLKQGTEERSIDVGPNTFQTSGEQQASINVYVQAFSSSGSAGVKSLGYVLGFIAGTDYTLPFKESFENGYVHSNPWDVESVDDAAYVACWRMLLDSNASRPADVYSYDSDGGMAIFRQTTQPVYECRFMAPQIDIAGKKAEMKYHLYHRSSVSSDNWVQVQACSGFSYFDIGEKILINSNSGWVEHTVEFDPEILGTSNFRPCFVGSGTSGTDFYLDNIRIVSSDPGSVENNPEESACVYAQDSMIIIKSATGTYTVYTIDGKQIAEGAVNGIATLNVEPGAYIVRINEKTTKILINR